MVSHKKKPAQKGRFLLILECTDVVQEGNIRKTMAARGLVNGRDPRSGRDLVFRCYPPELLLTPPKKTEADLLGQPLFYIGFLHYICTE